MYWKKIAYLDYLEHGTKIKNVGHVKVLLQQDVLSLDLHLRGLYPTDSLLTELSGITAQKQIPLGRLCVDKGSCYYNSIYPAANIDGKETRAEELLGICIKLSENRSVETFWKEKPQEDILAEQPSTFAKKKAETVPGAAKAVEAQLADGDTQYQSSEVTRPFQVLQQLAREVETPPADKAGEYQPEESPQQPEEPKDSDAVTQDEVYEDKWKQLCHTYQVVHPFGEEAFIRVAPKDFVILRQEYQQLVNNSFLLHGYYNYKHLILGRVRDDREGHYYLGVPGTYHEREKMVAVMFGFEGFESANERIESGTFGYYMKRVQI